MKRPNPEDSKILKQYILERESLLELEEILYVTNINLHPQINHISYNAGDNEYIMWDCEGNEFNFKALNYGERRNDSKRSLCKK